MRRNLNCVCSNSECEEILATCCSHLENKCNCDEIPACHVIWLMCKALFTEACFDLKCSCLDTFLPFVDTETSKNECVHKTHFKMSTHRNAFTNTLVHLCINSTELLVVFVGWTFICHKNIQCKQCLSVIPFYCYNSK